MNIENLPSEIRSVKVAELLGISYQTLQQMRQKTHASYRPHFPKARKQGHFLFFNTAEILDWKRKMSEKHPWTLSDSQNAQAEAQKRNGSVRAFDVILKQHRIFEMREKRRKQNEKSTLREKAQTKYRQ